ncbi:unnamed protein product [Arctogadus glacialis]
MTTTELHTPGPGEPLPGAEAAEGEAQLRSLLSGAGGPRQARVPPLGCSGEVINHQCFMSEVSERGGPGSERCGLEGRGSGGSLGALEPSHVYSPASGGGGVGGRGSNGQTGISQTHRLPPGHGKAGT